MTLVIYQDSRT